MNPLDLLGQCSLYDFKRVDVALTAGRPLPNDTYKKIHGLWAMSLLLGRLGMRKEPTTRRTVDLFVYSNNARLAATGLSIFVIFLIVLGKEYYSTRNVPLGPQSHVVTTSSCWHPPTNCCSITRGDWKQTVVAGKEHGTLREAPRNALYYYYHASRNLHGDETDVSCCGLRPLTSSTTRMEQHKQCQPQQLDRSNGHDLSRDENCYPSLVHPFRQVSRASSPHPSASASQQKSKPTCLLQGSVSVLIT